MHSLLDESVLAFEREVGAGSRSRSGEAAQSHAVSDAPDRADRPGVRADPGVCADGARVEALSDDVEILLGFEPSAGSLVGGFALGAAAGALATGLLVPALPALAFGAALGAYAGVLVTGLWASGTDAGRLTLRS